MGIWDSKVLRPKTTSASCSILDSNDIHHSLWASAPCSPWAWPIMTPSWHHEKISDAKLLPMLNNLRKALPQACVSNRRFCWKIPPSRCVSKPRFMYLMSHVLISYLCKSLCRWYVINTPHNGGTHKITSWIQPIQQRHNTKPRAIPMYSSH